MKINQCEIVNYTKLLFCKRTWTTNSDNEIANEAVDTK